jgi:hypothetical protein
MTTSLTLEPAAISAAVFQTWSASVGDDPVTCFPGVRQDTHGRPAWFELWVEQWQPRVQRRQSPELSDLRVTVHVFVRPALETGRIQELVAAARGALDLQTLPVLSGETIVGYVKLGAAEVRELSRSDADRHGLQHQLLLWRGCAQRVLSE